MKKILSNNMLVIKVRAMGDTLLATPALRALRRAYPEARITVLVSPAGKAVLEGNPDIDRIFVYERKSMWYGLKYLLKLNRSKYDLVLALHASFRTALMAYATGTKQRVAHNHSGNNFFSTIPITAKKESKSTIQRDLDAVRALGVPDAGEDLVFPLKKEDHAKADSFLAQNNLANDKPFWILAPGAGKDRKRWTAEAAIEFLDNISRGTKFCAPTCILLSGPEDEELTRTISRTAKCRPVVFNHGIKEAGALMTRSQGVITADSGPKHVAVAVGAKTLTLWTDEPIAEWHPYPLAQHALVKASTGIVTDLSAEEVLQAALRHFREK